MNRKLLFTLVISVFVISSFGNSMAAAAITPDATVNVAIVYSTGGLGDLSFNDAAKRGIDQAKAQYSDLHVDEACTSDCDIPDINQALETFAASSTVYDLIIGIGFSSGDGINASALAHTDRNFMIIDYVIDLPNVASVVFKEQEGSFLAGAMAAMTSTTGKLGFLGGLDIPLINRFGAGYEHGAMYINPNIKVTVAYSPDPNNPWGDLTGGAQVGNTMIGQGIDIIYSAAGGTGVGVINEVEDQNAAAGSKKYYAIGVDSDQDYISKGNVLTSMIKKVDVAVKAQIDAIEDGTWTNGFTSLGLKEGGVDISPMTYTQTEANTEYANGKSRIDIVNDLKQLIITGDIKVAEDFAAVDALNITTGYKGEPVQDSTFALPFPIIPFFFSVIAVAVIVRRRK